MREKWVSSTIRKRRSCKKVLTVAPTPFHPVVSAMYEEWHRRIARWTCSPFHQQQIDSGR
jgi:hypothetical protein